MHACIDVHIYTYIISLYTHIYAPPASILQRRDSLNCLIYAFNGKNGVLRRENNANRQSKLHFQAVWPGAEAQPEGEEKNICSPSKVVSVRTSKARCGKGRDETTRFQSFSRETGTSLRGKGDYLASLPPLPAHFPSPPPPGAPRAFWHPRSHCLGRCRPPNFLLLSSFAVRQSQREPEELLGPSGGCPGAYTCV